MQSLGEIVRSLELIESWARDLFPALIAIGAVLFSISDINKWLERSPNLLHHIKVDQIYVVEPLGDRLAIPTRFIESSEQIHMCLQLKCQKTHGAGYIDNRQYQLNESASDLAVDEKGLQSYIRGTGVQLEVTVFVRSAETESNRCPRPVCGFLNTDSGYV
ncbi:hypothetical protein FA15DRAFT_698752 [Coprinopsis marcescibilis]|uniref:Ubiquitin-like domain-containing protein n=1 Tax=Coprinopsis marcescibilis TaxID=230819 RepID=A0A5C3K8S1_COPMA|nr:hypothetical protein FA15DRAFT_698752 [Coprinopsis marcescibilis]